MNLYFSYFVIIILIAAFQEDVVQGLLSLCVPFYILYYMFAKFEHEKKGLIIAGALLGSIIGNVLPDAREGRPHFGRSGVAEDWQT